MISFLSRNHNLTDVLKPWFHQSNKISQYSKLFLFIIANKCYTHAKLGGDIDLLIGDRVCDFDLDLRLRLSLVSLLSLLSLLSLESLLLLCLLLGLLDLLLDLDLDLERLLDLRLLRCDCVVVVGVGGVGVGDLLLYLLFGGTGSFSGINSTGVGLRDCCLSPASISSSFSFFAIFFAL